MMKSPSSTSSEKQQQQQQSLPINYEINRRFTFYSERTDTLQSDNLYNLHPTESLSNLIKDNIFWIDITAPTSSDLKIISELFDIHPLSVEDIISDDGREKSEMFDDYMFISVRTCDIDYFQYGKSISKTINSVNNNAVVPMEQTTIYPINVYMLIFKTHLITIHAKPISHVQHVLRRVNPLKKQSVVDMSSDWFMYALLDDIVTEFIPNMKLMECEVDSIDELVLYLNQCDQTDMLRRIGRSRNQVNNLLRLLKPKTEIINILTKRHAPKLQEQTLLYLRDIQDHLMTMIQNLEQCSEMLNRSHNNYLAQISIELAEMSNRMNLQVKVLTQVTALALPFAIIGGLWGMNIDVPFEVINGKMVSLERLIPFFFLVFISVLMSIGFWFVGRRMKFF